ncbi:MAG: hypothetical protein RJA87_1429 [Pseudomonadota bacterium]
MDKPDNSCVFCAVKNIAFNYQRSNKICRFFEAEIVIKKTHKNLLSGQAIFEQNGFSDKFFILQSGLISLSLGFRDGSRQILRFVLPGEIFGIEPSGTLLHHATAEAVTASSYCAQPVEALKVLVSGKPEFAACYVTLLERDRLILQNSLVNLGRRDALSRVAYLLIELAVRSSGHFPLIAGYGYKIPLVQRLIADATGLTLIHVNRMLKKLRSEGYLYFRDGELLVLN